MLGGNWANLACTQKKSPFYTQHFKGGRNASFRRASGHVEGSGAVERGVEWGGGGGSQVAHLSLRSGRNWRRVFKMRDFVDLGQSGGISDNSEWLPQSSKTEEKKNHNTWRSWRKKKKSCCSKKEIEDEEIDAGATKPSWCVLLCCVAADCGAVARTDMSPDKDGRRHAALLPSDYPPRTAD